MASIAFMTAGALVNALAFSGSNFVFSQMSGTDEETKRHDLALEQLTQARNQWNQRRETRLDYINTKLQKQNHSQRTFSDVNYAMRQYSEQMGESLPSLGKEPTLDMFYTPSQDQKDREIYFVTGGLLISGGLIYYFI